MKYHYLSITEISVSSFEQFKKDYTEPEFTVIYLESKGGDLNVAIEWAMMIKSPVILRSAESAAAHFIFIIPPHFRYYFPQAFIVFKPITIQEYTEEIVKLLEETQKRLLPFVVNENHPLSKKTKPLNCYECLTYRTLQDWGFKPHYQVPYLTN